MEYEQFRLNVLLNLILFIFRLSEEANDPSLGKFSKLLKCMMRQQSKEPGGLSNMDWGQWQAAGGGGVQFPPNWNANNRNQQPPGWIRPGSGGQQQQQPPQQPGWPPGPQNQPGMGPGGPGGPGGGQPRPGVHPDDWNSNNRNHVPPPPNGPPQGKKLVNLEAILFYKDIFC